jgi:hypothetical protein
MPRGAMPVSDFVSADGALLFWCFELPLHTANVEFALMCSFSTFLFLCSASSIFSVNVAFVMLVVTCHLLTHICTVLPPRRFPFQWTPATFRYPPMFCDGNIWCLLWFCI